MVNRYLLDHPLNNLSLSLIFAFISCSVWIMHLMALQFSMETILPLIPHFLALGVQQPLCICSLSYISALATRHSVQLHLSFG